MKLRSLFPLAAFALLPSCGNPENPLTIPEAVVNRLGDLEVGSYTLLPVQDEEGAISSHFTLVVKTGEFVNEKGFNSEGQVGTLQVSNLKAYDALVDDAGNITIKYTSYAWLGRYSCHDQSYKSFGNAQGLEGRLLSVPERLQTINNNSGCDGTGWDVYSSTLNHRQFMPEIG